MATIRTIGTGIGGVGRSNITLGVTGVFESQATVRTVAMQNENSPLYVQQAITKYAATTFTAPANTAGVMIVLPEAGTQPVSTGINAAFVAGGLVLPANGAVLLTNAVALTDVRLSCASVIAAMRAAVFSVGYIATAVTCQNAAETITLATHGLIAGDVLQFAAVSMPAGLTAATNYYVINPTTNTFQVALTPGGSVEAFTTDGTSVTITTQYANIITVAAHGLSVGDIVAFSAGGGLPSGLSTTVVYYVVSVTTNTFRVSLTPSGTTVNLITAGSSPVVDEVANVTLHWL